MEILGNFFVPQCYVGFTVVNDGAQLRMFLKIILQAVHALDTVDEVDNTIFIRLLIQSLNDVVNSFAENSRQTVPHRRIGKRISVEKDKERSKRRETQSYERVIASECRPWRVVRVDLYQCE